MLCALKDTYPLAITCRDVCQEQAHWRRVFEEHTVPAIKEMTTRYRNQAWFQVAKLPTHAFLLLTSLDQIAWAATAKVCKNIQLPLAAQPRNQCDAWLQLDVLLWIKTEQTEADTMIERNLWQCWPAAWYIWAWLNVSVQIENRGSSLRAGVVMESKVVCLKGFSDPRLAWQNCTHLFLLKCHSVRSIKGAYKCNIS